METNLFPLNRCSPSTLKHLLADRVSPPGGCFSANHCGLVLAAGRAGFGIPNGDRGGRLKIVGNLVFRSDLTEIDTGHLMDLKPNRSGLQRQVGRGLPKIVQGNTIWIFVAREFWAVSCEY